MLLKLRNIAYISLRFKSRARAPQVPIAIPRIQAKCLMKMINKAPKKWYVKPAALREQPRALEIYDPARKIRADRLNSNFMSYITDLLSTGEVCPELLDTGLEITRIRVNRNFTMMAVFWYCNDSSQDEQIEKLLEQARWDLRAYLTRLRIIGYIPIIYFKKDKKMTAIIEVEEALSRADFGFGYTPVGKSLLNLVGGYQALPSGSRNALTQIQSSSNSGEIIELPPSDVLAPQNQELAGTDDIGTEAKFTQFTHKHDKWSGDVEVTYVVESAEGVTKMTATANPIPENLDENKEKPEFPIRIINEPQPRPIDMPTNIYGVQYGSIMERIMIRRSQNMAPVQKFKAQPVTVLKQVDPFQKSMDMKDYLKEKLRSERLIRKESRRQILSRNLGLEIEENDPNNQEDFEEDFHEEKDFFDEEIDTDRYKE